MSMTLIELGQGREWAGREWGQSVEGNYIGMPNPVNLPGKPEPNHQTSETEAREKGGMDK